MPMSEDKVGDIRVVRADIHNYSVERYEEIKSRDGSTKLEWQTLGWFGGNIVAAFKVAVQEGLPVGEAVTLQAFNAAVARLVEIEREPK